MKQGLRIDATSGTAVGLQETLTELIDLSLQAKHAHWNVVGPLFTPLHQQLDTITEAYRTWYDDVAERLRALGCLADGRASTVAARTPMSPLPEGPIEDRTVAELLEARLDLVAARIRARMAGLEAHDAVTFDLLVGIVGGLEKQAWMLRAMRS
jgi:starvation-inducible DNA-binding protein